MSSVRVDTYTLGHTGFRTTASPGSSWTLCPPQWECATVTEPERDSEPGVPTGRSRVSQARAAQGEQPVWPRGEGEDGDPAAQEKDDSSKFADVFVHADSCSPLLSEVGLH